MGRQRHRLMMLALALACGLATSLGCNAVSGIDSLEKVDCVGNCGGWGQGGGSANPPMTTPAAMGRYSSCAHTTSGQVLCWGIGLPDGDGRLHLRPTNMPALAEAERINISTTHGCVVLNNQLFCWGRNHRGQLGNGTFEASLDPVPVLGPGGTGTLDNVRRSTVGNNHTCVQTVDNDALCWGANDHGQLGDGTTDDSAVPLLVSLPQPVNKISGGGQFTCAALVDNRVFCWGRNHRGQLGQGTASDTPQLSPVEVIGVTDAEKVYGGGEHVCVQTVAGEAWCWGANDWGQLGDNSTQDSAMPVAPIGVSSVEYLSPGVRHTCAQTPGGLLCWGANDYGQLANDVVGSSSPAPVMPNAGGLDGTQLLEDYSGGMHVCARYEVDQAIWCWGLNDAGQIGNGSTGGATPPTRIGP